ncbi:MAG: hypothetical protein KAU50_04030, partial [Candidatus Marinimicrobia bacterium]|nr:hypothetical protein [Candidatus Neomarinimicrobiota bacterium]
MNPMKFAVGFGVAVIFPLMVHYGVATFSPPPDRDDYQPPHRPVAEVKMSEEEITEWEAQRDAINQEYKAHAKVFARRLFWVAAPIGLVVLALGAILKIPAIGTGLVFGAIFTLLDAYGNYWQYLPNALRFVSLLLA